MLGDPGQVHADPPMGMKIPSLKHFFPKGEKFAGQEENLTMEKLLTGSCEKGFGDAGYRSLLAPPQHCRSLAPAPGAHCTPMGSV